MFLAKYSVFCSFSVRVRVFGPFIGQILCFWLKYSVFCHFSVRVSVFWPFYRSNSVFWLKYSVFFTILGLGLGFLALL